MIPRRLFALAPMLFASRLLPRMAGPTTTVVEIVGRDYAFTSQAELPSGAATFRFSNEGTVYHELAVALLKDGVTGDQVVAAVNGKGVKPLVEASVGILLAPAGRRSATGLSTRLLAGRTYLVICRLQDSASAPMHSQMGMVSVIRVRAGAPTATPVVRTDTIVGLDYTYRLPRAMKPGAHRLAFVDSGAVKHEVNVALLRRGVRSSDVVAIAQRGGNLIPLVERWVGVLTAVPGRTTPGELNVDLLVGREYVFLCELADDEHSPRHIKLGMFGSITPRW